MQEIKDRLEDSTLLTTLFAHFAILAMDRIQKLRASIGVLAGSLRFRADLELNRLPTSIRSMTVEEFWFKYNGNAKEYLKLQTRVKTEANTSFLHAIGMDHKR